MLENPVSSWGHDLNTQFAFGATEADSPLTEPILQIECLGKGNFSPYS